MLGGLRNWIHQAASSPTVLPRRVLYWLSSMAHLTDKLEFNRLLNFGYERIILILWIQDSIFTY